MGSDALVDVLNRIDAKLQALLALSVEQMNSGEARRRTRPRLLDQTLSDAGLSAKEIAVILGKTDRAVRMALQGTKSVGPDEENTT